MPKKQLSFGDVWQALYDHDQMADKRSSAELDLEECADEEKRLKEEFGTAINVQYGFICRLIGALKEGKLNETLDEMLGSKEMNPDELDIADLWTMLTKDVFHTLDYRTDEFIKDYAELVKAVVLMVLED